MDVMMLGAAAWPALAAMGLGVGTLAGLFGVGGGFLLTPLLAILFNLPMEIAVGTGLCQMIGAATAAHLRFSRLRVGEPKLAWMMIAGSLLGVQLGANTVQALDRLGTVSLFGRPIEAERLGLSLGYILLLAGVAAWMGADARRPSLPGIPRPPGPIARMKIPPYTLLPKTGHKVSIPVVSYCGLIVGYLSGLLGIGGGVILVPLLVYGIGMRMATASGTGVGVLLCSTIYGTFVHASMGNVHLGIALILLIGSSLGAQVGALLATRMDGQKLRGGFALLVALTAMLVTGDLFTALQ